MNDCELSITVCGHFNVAFMGNEILLPGRKAMALVAVLALEHPKPQSREVLCNLLWPNVEQTNARSSLRQCLTSLRKAFGTENVDPFCTKKDQISIDYPQFQCDLNSFLNSREPEAAKHLSEHLPRLLTDLGFISEEFEFWASEKRRQSINAAQAQLHQIFGDTAYSPDTRIACAKAALMLDELDEHAIRTLMRCYADSSNSAKALRIYNEFFQMLEQNLDAEPSIATQDLAVSIKLSQGPESTDHPAQIEVSSPATARTTSVTIAVMPFELFGSAKSNEFLQIGVMDQITCHLASFRAPAVISSNTTRRYLGQCPRPSDVGRDLKAKYVLTGFMRIDGLEAVISTQLVESKTEEVLWATTEMCDADTLTGLRLPIANEIARAIVPSVEAEELRQTQAITTQELEPYHLVLRAKDLIFGLDQNDFHEAGLLLRKAVELGPHFAPGHALLAHWCTIALWEDRTGNAAASRAELEQHLSRAHKLAPRDGRVIALSAHNYMMLDRDYDVALARLNSAIELLPNDSETLAWSVPTLTCTRNPNEAVRNGQRAIDLSPLDPFLARNEHFLSFALFTQGDYDRSAEYGLSCYKRHPDFYSGNLRVTIAALCAAGRKSETIELVERHNQIAPNFLVSEFKEKQRLRDAGDRSTFASLLVDAGLPNCA